MTSMVRTLGISMLFVLVFVVSLPAFAGEEATPQEVVAKIKEAKEFLVKAGDPGLVEFNDTKGRWAWKDTYVFVFDCEGQKTLIAHINPKLVGMDLAKLIDPTGRNLALILCEGAGKPEGSWVEYLWPRMVLGDQKPVRKISFTMNVPGARYQVGAGIYNETITMGDLEKIR